jgi:ligand-binding sensor domain-containing protein
VMVGGHLVVGTDVGVFVSGLHGGTWKALGAGLPTTVVNDLDVTPNGDLVIAATHGRGLWSIGTGALG